MPSGALPGIWILRRLWWIVQADVKAALLFDARFNNRVDGLVWLVRELPFISEKDCSRPKGKAHSILEEVDKLTKGRNDVKGLQADAGFWFEFNKPFIHLFVLEWITHGSDSFERVYWK
jgi:hypothetical protein